MVRQREVGEHITRTYRMLRRGMALIAFAFPLVLLLGGMVLFARLPQTSMSAYYYTEMRDVFVGVLCAVGAFLVLYRGFSDREEWALNIAGLSGVGIALFPMAPKGDCSTEAAVFSAHGFFAVVFFLAISYVCIFLAAEGPRLGIDSKLREHYERITRICGFVMMVCIGLSLAYCFFMPADLRIALCQMNVVFWLEAIAVWAFSAYWIVKSLEYDHSFSWLPWRTKA
jgi:hypothetical protein